MERPERLPLAGWRNKRGPVINPTLFWITKKGSLGLISDRLILGRLA